MMKIIRDFAFKIVARRPRCKPVGQAQKFLSEVYPVRYIELKNLRARPNGAAYRSPQQILNAKSRIIAGNWKMNFGPQEAIEYFKKINTKFATMAQNGIRQVIFPVSYALGNDVQDAAKHAGFELGAQNVHWQEKGAFTGELSGTVLKNLGVNWVLIAHSERRQFFGETDETAAKRFSFAVSLGLNCIYCIGEKLEEREANQTEDVLKKQMKYFNEAYTNAHKNQSTIVSIAYEPVWAIGTGKTATPEQAQSAHLFIRSQLSANLPILYGGSVTAQNAQILLEQPDVDGLLVGGASLKPAEFQLILQAAHTISSKKH